MWEIVPLAVDTNPAGGLYWTVHTVVEQRVRHICQTASGGSYYAVITLCAEPYRGPEGNVFINAAPPDDEFIGLYGEPEDAQVMQSYHAGVVEGVSDALHQKVGEGFPVKGLLVALTELRVHAVDSKPSAYRRAAAMGLEACLERANLVFGIGPDSQQPNHHST